MAHHDKDVYAAIDIPFVSFFTVTVELTLSHLEWNSGASCPCKELLNNRVELNFFLAEPDSRV